MSLLDNAEMPHAVSIYGPTLSTDAGGGTNVAFTTLIRAGVPCQIMFGAGGERNEYSQSEFQRNSHTIAFNEQWADDIARGEEFVDDATSKRFRLTGISRKQGIGSIPDYLIVSVTEVE